MSNTKNLIQPQATYSSLVPTENGATIAESLDPTVLVQYGGISVAVILAISILILTLAEYSKVIIEATRGNKS